MREKRGFTLVELLVVIAILAVLAVIGITVFSLISYKSRAAKRIADLKAVRTALDGYYYDPANNGLYPSTGGVWFSQCTAYPGGGKAQDQVIPGLVPKYLASLPSDPEFNPSSTSQNYCYAYKSDGIDYAFLNYLYVGVNTEGNYPAPFLDPQRPTYAIKIYTSGAKFW